MNTDKWPKIPSPYKKEEIKCPSCGKDSGWTIVLMMVIPPEGLKCHKCGAVVALPTQITFS